MIFDGCIFDPAIFEAEVCAAPPSGGRQAWRPPQRLPSPEPPEDQNDLAILLLLT